MRGCDSAYDRATSEWHANDPGQGLYAMIIEKNGPISRVGYFDSLATAVIAARSMDIDDVKTDLEDEIGYDASRDRDSSGLVHAALRAGWRVVAAAPASENWVVLYEPEPETLVETLV